MYFNSRYNEQTNTVRKKQWNLQWHPWVHFNFIYSIKWCAHKLGFIRKTLDREVDYRRYNTNLETKEKLSFRRNLKARGKKELVKDTKQEVWFYGILIIKPIALIEEPVRFAFGKRFGLQIAKKGVLVRKETKTLLIAIIHSWSLHFL